jgi:putative nucleotidyltransferase with HDIG domain
VRVPIYEPLGMNTLHPPATTSVEPLAKMVRRIQDISTLPHIALQVMKVADDANATANDLKQIMESDPSLSARVLRCVNSSAYALRTKITNLQRAIAFLGMKQIRNLATTAAVSVLFQKDEAIGGYRRSQLWSHLVSVGLCSRMIAMRIREPEFEDMFLAGLLHDVGIVLEDQNAHSRFVTLLQNLSPLRTLSEQERDVFGFDHAKLGAEVAAAWKFPECVQAAIRFHHASAQCQSSELRIVQCVELANVVCTAKGYTSIGMKLVRFEAPVLDALGLTKDDLAVLLEDLDADLAANSNLFQI